MQQKHDQIMTKNKTNIYYILYRQNTLSCLFGLMQKISLWRQKGCIQDPTCLFPQCFPSTPSPRSLCFSLSYSAHHRSAWRQSDVFSACSFTCTCQRSWMSHPNWQQMVLFGYERPDPSAQPTLQAIYHHSPSLSPPPQPPHPLSTRPLRGLWTTILCAIIYLCAGECQPCSALGFLSRELAAASRHAV